VLPGALPVDVVSPFGVARARRADDQLQVKLAKGALAGGWNVAGADPHDLGLA
jgi:hypothetical protein